MKVPPVHIEVQGKPISFKPRKYSEAEKEYIENWIHELLELGFIVQTEDTEWCSPIYVVKQGGKFRLTIICEASIAG